MAQTFSKIIKLSIIFILILACSDTQEEVEVNDISLPPEGPPSFPYIFEGKFYLDGEPGREEPTSSGFGTISSSGLSDVPAPNLNSVLPSSLINVVNLLVVFNNYTCIN